MKKNILCLCLIMMMAITFIGCGQTSDAVEKTKSFTGVISKISEGEAIVVPDEGEDIRKSGDAVTIYIGKEADKFSVGDKVTVTYDGDIMESYPLQVRVIKVEKVK